ncbi:MAG: gamma-glutamylcyclotransferase family protein [Candidatus Eremiobacterota bacterium]
MPKPFFAYGPMTREDACREILGRTLQGEPARLSGYRVEKDRGYSFLVEADGAVVDGLLFRTLQAPDYWVLDQYQNVEQGLYRRETVEVEANGGREEAYTYLGGPTLS